MPKDVGAARLFWNFLKEDCRPILLGLAVGTALSALFPQFTQMYIRLTDWLWNPVHAQKIAVTFLIGIVAASALLLWLVPASIRWWRSWQTGANRGSFVVPAVAAFLIFRLAGLVPSCGWRIAAVLIVLVGTGILFFSVNRSSASVLKDCSDDPQVSLAQAWPERRDLAQQVADSIRHDGKPTYAIYGDFGSGKSSMLNFIEDALRSDSRDRPIIVRFNGWLPGSKENLADQLLSDIATECSKEFYVPHLRRTALKVARTIVTTVPHFGSLTEWLPQETQGDIVNDLKSVLARLPKRIVVFVDEIDRMRKEELLVLLKLIRGFSSLPHLSFVCALERRQVEKMIKDEFGDVEHTFYQKFFSDSFRIPRLVDSFLESETHDTLTTIFRSQGWFREDEQAQTEYSDAIHQYWKAILAPLCTNIREIHRLASAVRSEAWPLIDEVNSIDLTFVSALRCFAPEALDLMWKFRDTLCALDIESGIAESDKVYEAAVTSYLEREDALAITPLVREQAQRIRRVVFSGLDEVESAKASDSNHKVTVALKYFERNKLATRTRSLRSNSYFPAYFQSVLPVTIFPEKELMRLFKELNQSDELQTGNLMFREIKKLDGNSDKNLTCWKN